MAAFLTGADTGVPLPLSRVLKHNHALHERVLLVNVQTSEAPRVPDERRVEATDMGAGVTRVLLRYGFTERPDVPAGLQLAMDQGRIEPMDPAKIS